MNKCIAYGFLIGQLLNSTFEIYQLPDWF